MEKAVIKIFGMTCTLCSILIESRLKVFSGISSISVSYASEKAVIDYDSRATSLEAIKKAIEQLGFSVSENDTEDSSKKSLSELQKLKRLLIVSSIFGYSRHTCKNRK